MRVPDSRVSAAAVEGYDVSVLEAAVERQFQALGVWDDLRPGMRVVLKPNLLMRRAPEGATTTHPAVVEAVARTLQKHGVRDITLADSPGGPFHRVLLEGIYAACGMAAAARAAGFLLNDKLGWRELSCEAGELCRSFQIIEVVADADFVVNLPKLKTHAMTALSGGVKNLLGCVPGLQKPELHFRFPEPERFAAMLVDLSLLVRPGVTLVDAVVSMEGDGPSAGRPKHTGMTFAARSPHALDLGLCAYIGMEPNAVATVAQSIRRGLCPPDADELAWLCDGKPAADPFRPPASKSILFTGHVPRPLRGPVEWLEKRFLTPRPAVHRAACIGCGKCAESCAPGAMVIRDKKAELDFSKCIRCYCCHEMCPVQAIGIKRFQPLNF